MAYTVVLNKKFIVGLSNTIAYLEQEWNRKVADDFLDEIEKRIESLQAHPFIGAPVKMKNIRGIHITKHNRMYYGVTGNNVTILNLYDTRRKNYS